MKPNIDNDDTELTTQLPSAEDDQACFELINSDLETQLPASDDIHTWTQLGETDFNTEPQASGGGHDLQRSRADHVAHPSAVGNQVVLGGVVTQAAHLSSSEDIEAGLATRIQEVREQLKNVLSKKQIQTVVDSLVSTAAFTTQVANVPSSAPSAASRPAPSSSNDVPFFETCIFKKGPLTTPPPKQTATPRAPRQQPTPIAQPPKVRKQIVIKSGPKVTPFRETQLRRGLEHSINDLFNSPAQKLQESSRIPTTTADNSCRLLSLPGELRNRIYRFVLLNPKTVEIDRMTWTDHQPALVRTCKQIRGEALPLFYQENRIAANIHDWDPKLKERLNQLVLSHCGCNTKCNLPRHVFSGGPHWANLLKWLKAAFEGHAVALNCVADKQRSMERKIVGLMFKIVGKAVDGSRWAGVLDLLGAHRHLLAMVDEKWLVDATEAKAEKAT